MNILSFVLSQSLYSVVEVDVSVSVGADTHKTSLRFDGLMSENSETIPSQTERGL